MGRENKQGKGGEGEGRCRESGKADLRKAKARREIMFG